MNRNSPYTEWQEKWQSSEASSVPPLTEELFSRLEEEDRRTARINRIKTIALAAIFLVMGLQLYAFPLPQKSWTLPLGLIWVAANTLIYFRSVLKRQFSIRKLDLGLPSLQFVRQAMVKVQEEFLYVRRSLGCCSQEGPRTIGRKRRVQQEPLESRRSRRPELIS